MDLVLSRTCVVPSNNDTTAISVHVIHNYCPNG